MIYYTLIISILKVRDFCVDDFGRYLISGISFYFFIQVFINISMTLGILPVVGLPLIFISYGGTHIIVEFLSAGIILNILENAKRIWFIKI